MEFVSRTKQIPQIFPLEDNIPSWVQKLLYSRGITSGDGMKAFLHPDADQLESPMALPGMAQLKETVNNCRREKGSSLRVTVYGDYDVDGICASTIMEQAFKLLGVQARVRIPDRHEEGYGLNMSAVEEMSTDTDLIVTVDCGITSVAEVKRARELGMRVLVTDHHTPGEELPPADAVVDPMLAGEGYSPLCGAGVALKVLWALHGWARAEEYLDICALATVADLVPLTGENRVLVHLGLDRINRCPRTGIAALESSAGIRDTVTADKIAFQLAPRLNAAGRLESASLSYQLLVTEDLTRARELAEKLEKLNQARRKLEEDAFREAQRQAEAQPLKDLRGLVVFHPDWDTGVIGLVAGKLAEKYAYPTICLTVNRAGEYQGSGRSACGVNLYEALKSCQGLLTRFGGHKQAAGLALKEENYPAFIRAFSDAVTSQLGEDDLHHALEYDLEEPLDFVNEANIRRLAELEPFGMGNPRPVFLFSACQMEMRAVGAEGKHLKCRFFKEGSARDGIWFSHGYLAGDALPQVDFLAEMSLNVFQGRVSPQVSVRGMRQNPQGLADNDAFLREGCLKDLKTADDLAAAAGKAVYTEAPWEEVPFRHRGVLYLTRRMTTAASVADRYPQLEMMSPGDLDTRAYSAIALGVGINQIPGEYDLIVLCDGTMGDGEIAALNTLCPGSRVIAAPSSAAADIRRSLLTDKETLRVLYKCFRRWDELGLMGACGEAGVDPPTLKWGAEALKRVGLAEIIEAPYTVRLLPRPPGITDPTKSTFYRLTAEGK